MTPLDVTVVVCTYNRADSLGDALRSLIALETEGRFAYEVLVVSGSTDHTAAVVEAISRESPVPVRCVAEPRLGVPLSRNRGIAEARGEWIAFFDDDQLAEPRWLLELLTLVRVRGVRAAAGARTLLLPEGRFRPLPHFCRLLLGEDCGGAVGPDRYGRKMLPNTGNILIRRDVFAEVGGFDESLTICGEDSWLYLNMRRAGIAVWYTPDAVVQHVIPAYRLQDDYFSWVCLRHGWNTARWYWKECGPAVRLLLLLARLGQAAVVHLPRFLRRACRATLRRRWDGMQVVAGGRLLPQHGLPAGPAAVSAKGASPTS